MSPVFRPDPFAGDHGRARELAALRLDEPLAAADDTWLVAHLAACADCREIAAAYEDQRVALRALRATAPEPPRDLWARTAAAIEAEGGRGSRDRGAVRGAVRGWRLGPLPLAPAAGLLVIAIAVGAGLLNGVNLFPPGASPSTSGAPEPTPIALTAGDVRVLRLGPDGVLELSTRQIDEVCPVGADTCGTSGQSDSTTIAGVGDLGDFDAVISPKNDQIVLMDRGTEGSGVFVVTVRHSVDITPAPATPTPATPATPAPTPEVTIGPGTSETPPVSPDTTTVPTESATPSAELPTPTPAPTADVTPIPDGTLEIARDVILVGGVAGYSPDGNRFAFTARPADGSTGPDVYVWVTSEPEAHPVTDDHASLFADWVGDRMLVSRVVDGKPETILLDPASGAEEAIPDSTAWRPVVGPDGRTAVWWDGTVQADADGLTWRAGEGRLLLGAWPDSDVKAQVLASGKVGDWEVSWDDEGTVLGLWVEGKDSDGPGRLSLYVVDAQTGAVNLDDPLLEDVEAFPGFSLRTGRLAWSAPADGDGTTVEVLAWSGDNFGRLQLTTERGSTVVR